METPRMASPLNFRITLTPAPPFNLAVSRELDCADAALDEIGAAARHLRAAHNLQPDELPLGRALAETMFVGLAAVEQRRALVEGIGL